jgi:hypothetical protein
MAASVESASKPNVCRQPSCFAAPKAVMAAVMAQIGIVTVQQASSSWTSLY